MKQAVNFAYILFKVTKFSILPVCCPSSSIFVGKIFPVINHRRCVIIIYQLHYYCYYENFNMRRVADMWIRCAFSRSAGEKWLDFRFVKANEIRAIHLWRPHGGLRWTHVDGGREGQAPCGRLHRKLESTDVTLSSSHAKNLMSFLLEVRLWTE